MSNSHLDTYAAYGYNSTIKRNKGCEGKKYLFAERTESSRLMRGAQETDGEYIPELCTEGEFRMAGKGLEGLEIGRT